MTRPLKYLNDSERVEARRQQTREHVRAHRARKKHAPADSTPSASSTRDGLGGRSEAATTSSSDSLMTTPRLSPPIDTIFGTPEERRSFHYFRQVAVHHLAGCIKTNFWLRLVPQAHHEEPAIRHCIAAFASLHEGLAYNRATEAPARAWTMFGLSQYCKALKSLTDLETHSDQPKLDVVLACCALFVCIELLLGHSETALMHIDRGIDIMNNVAEADKDKAFRGVPMSDLWHLMRRLDTQAALWHTSRVPRLQEQWSMSSLIPKHFMDTESALQPLCKMFHKLMRTTRTSSANRDTLGSVYPDDNIRLSQLVDQYEVALNNSLDKGYLSDSSLSGVILLRVFVAWLRLTLYCDNAVSCAYQSQKIFAYVQILLDGADIAKSRAEMSKQWPPFTLDAGVLGPLCSVFTMSQDDCIKAEALKLMAPCLAQEGFLHASVVLEDFNKQWH